MPDAAPVSSADLPVKSSGIIILLSLGIIGLHEVKPIGRCIKPQRFPVPGFQSRLQVVGDPFSYADQGEALDHGTYLMMQEGPGSGVDEAMFARLLDVQPVKRFQRPVGLTVDGRTCRESMSADEDR